MKKWFRILSTLLAAVMLLSCAGAASAEYTVSIDDAPTLNVVIPTIGVHTEDAATVEAALNEILVPLTGAKVHLTFTSFSSHSQQISMMLTNAYELDMTLISGNPSSYIENGQALDLTKYIESDDSKVMRETIGEPFVEANRWSDGEIYYLDIVHDHATELSFSVSSKIYKELGYEIDDTKMWTFDEIHDLLVKVRDNYPTTYGIIGAAGYTDWDSLGDGANIGVIGNRGKDTKVTSVTENQSFIDFTHMMHEWYNEGLVMPDIMNNTESAIAMMIAGTGFGHFVNGPCPNGMESEDSYRVLLSLNEPWIRADSTQVLGYIINSQTQYPDEAFRVLRELYTNEQVKTLLCFGIEGTHYAIGEDGRAVYPEGMDADTATYNPGFLNWFVFPNGQCDLAPYTQDPNYWQMTRDYDAAADPNPLLGCVFNPATVADAYAACSNVYDQYYAYLMAGVLDPDEMIPEFADALKAAGEDEVIAAKQAMVDAYLSR